MAFVPDPKDLCAHENHPYTFTEPGPKKKTSLETNISFAEKFSLLFDVMHK